MFAVNNNQLPTSTIRNRNEFLIKSVRINEMWSKLFMTLCNLDIMQSYTHYCKCPFFEVQILSCSQWLRWWYSFHGQKLHYYQYIDRRISPVLLLHWAMKISLLSQCCNHDSFWKRQELIAHKVILNRALENIWERWMG